MAGPGPQSLDRRQAWYGPAYVETICAQAGYLWTAGPAEGDVHSFDGTLTVHPGSTVSVQVKCRRKAFSSSASYRIKPAWRQNWEVLDLPAFMVVVVVPGTVSNWVQHEVQPTRRTIHDSSAYWARIDPLLPGQKSVKVMASDRFTADTIPTWCDMYQDAISLSKGFSGGDA